MTAMRLSPRAFLAQTRGFLASGVRDRPGAADALDEVLLPEGAVLLVEHVVEIEPLGAGRFERGRDGHAQLAERHRRRVLREDSQDLDAARLAQRARLTASTRR